jgi:uncharacterized protein (DUF362 family)
MHISRRQFLQYGAGALVAAPCAYYAKNAITKMRRKQAMASYTVSIAKNNDPASAVRRSMELLGGMGRIVKPGERVLIKPNNIVQQYIPGTVTSAEVVAALAVLVKEAGGKPIVGENFLTAEVECGKRYRAALAAVNLADEVPLVDLIHDHMVEVEIKNARVFHKTRIARTALEADKLIDVPILKTHDQTGVTLGIKNLKGLIPKSEMKRSHEESVEKAIVDLCSFVQPSLVVIDGITGAEGVGPVNGPSVKMNTIIAGTNALATDMVGASVMGFDVEEIKHLQYAVASKLGPRGLADIEVAGCPISTTQRPFIRAAAVIRDQYKEMGIQVISHNACSGCWAEFRHIYYAMQNDRTKLRGTTFILGRVEDIPRVEKVIVIGQCARAVCDRGVYVPGCPPHHTAIEKAARQQAGI